MGPKPPPVFVLDLGCSINQTMCIKNLCFTSSNKRFFITFNNISINFKLGWIFIWVLELIRYGCAYSLICDMMMRHMRIGEYETWVDMMM